MLRTVSSAQENHTNWADFIRHKTDFYVSNSPRQRTDPGFPWSQIDPPLPDPQRQDPEPPGFLDKVFGRGAPAAQAAGRSAADDELRKTQQRHIRNFDKASEKLFEVRRLFADDLSRFLFDETIVLRLAGHNNFFGPRTYFDEVVRKTAETPFRQPGFPDTYLGVPLVDMSVAFSTLDRAFELDLVVPQGFDVSFNTNRQYFITRDGVDFMPAKGDTVFDCGACIGENSAIFAALAGALGRVYAFDPIPLHTRFCALQGERNAGTSAPIEPVNFAVGNETEEVEGGVVEEIDAISPGGLQISKFNITRLDDFCERYGIERVDYIKMDIEAAEPDALEGAARILRAHKPKLAISTYHRPDQFWSIPLQIKEINPEYRLYFGHHSPVRWESVVYAC